MSWLRHLANELARYSVTYVAQISIKAKDPESLIRIHIKIKLILKFCLGMSSLTKVNQGSAINIPEL